MRRKILTILGTRPEIIRLSRIIPKLDQVCDHRVLHTGQNYDPTLNDIFFEELELRRPDMVLESRGTIGEQLAATFVGVEKYCKEFQPDAVLVLGDTNSGLSAVVCERMGIPVYHMEAGNRCYDLSVPEEKNRRIIDHVASVNLPYTGHSRENLLREGLPNNKIFVTGNPIREVLNYYSGAIQHSNVVNRLGLAPHQYIVATAHRAENVDNPVRLANILEAFETISQDLPIVFSCHPKTEQRMTTQLGNRIIISKPMGFFDWVNLERNSRLAISDSGTVQEEMCLFRKPTITIRATTERPETVMCGSNIITGLEVDSIVAGYRQALTLGSWTIPEEYTRPNVSDVVVNIIIGNHV
jgi:UDP-N-acetylglucosamine 2-epimerase (non-hydrolysing)